MIFETAGSIRQFLMWIEKGCSMADKKNAAVRTCGGCFCKFDRRGIFNELSNKFRDSWNFKFSYDLTKDEEYDLVVLINGCDSECAEPSESRDNLIIDHTNWERASEVFAEKAELLQ